MAASFENTELLKKTELKSSVNLLHRLVDGICHRPRPAYDEFSKIWSLQDWWALTDTYTDLFKEAVKNTWTKDTLFEKLQGLDDDYKSVVFDVVDSRRADIRSQLLNDSHALSQANMTDFDWKLKLVMSSDKISSVQEPDLALDMEVQTTEGRKTVSVELNKQQLSNLINSLEGANKALVQLKS
ncbi:COMM domain-containing protein 8-like [Mercenaria mercenaria]|uniref:COMM domain-containing protein 8-like n=1 Tax=Mercenaria mercenaria TaxID=6596 RepID=UPI00234F6B48|nr:COMM domain-containing protein 8-like [Mercenaria mercenaria]